MEMNRRQFVIAATAASACIAGGMSCEAHAASADPTPKQPVECGSVSDYSHDGAFDTFAKDKRIMLVRKSGRLYATTATCSHRNCVIKSVANDLRCPCHGSRFTLDGTVAKGPAQESLVRYGISSSNGKIVVDPTKKFAQNQWDDPQCFVSVG
jgi:Rieske Fe-S protein